MTDAAVTVADAGAAAGADADVRPSPARAERVARIAAAVAVLVVVGVAAKTILAHGGGPHALRARYGPWAPVVSIPILAVTSWTLLPSEFIGVAHGSTYGFAFGALANWTGWMLTALLQFTLVRYGVVGRASVDRLERMPAGLRRLPVSHPVFLIVGRQLPFGSAIVNTLGPGMGVRLWRHLWCAAIGLLPVSLLCAGIGAGIWR